MNKVKCVAACAAVGAVLLVAPGAHAAPMTHDGFYLSAQAGFGYLSSSVDDFDASISGMTYSTALLLGGTVGPVVIGGGFTYDNAFSPSYEVGGRDFDTGDVDINLH